MSEPYIGEIHIFANNYAIRGYAFCDGQLLPIAQNTALFSILGTTYGGDGRTTFGLPNLQGRAATHSGGSAGPGLTFRPLGSTGGSDTVTLAASQVPSHTHTLNGRSPEFAAGTGDPTNNSLRGVQLYAAAGSSNTAMSDQAVSSVGNGQSHDNRSPYQAVNFQIALVGAYPPRS